MPEFDRLVDRIYEAAVMPDAWPSVLTDLARTVGGEGGMLATRRNDGQGLIGYRTSPNLATGAEECVRSGGVARSLATPRLLAANRCGFVSDQELFTPEEYAADALTVGWILKNNVYHGAATAILIPSGDLAILQFMRRKGLPPLSRSEIDCLDRFRPHLARAGLLAARLRLERIRAAAEALAIVGLPAAVLDFRGRVLAANGLIEAMTSHVVWLAEDRIAFTDSGATALFRAAIPQLADPAAASVRSFPVLPESPPQPAVAHLIPLSTSARDLFLGALGVLIVTPVTAPIPPDTGLIQGLFDLTPAEARVACAIVTGMTLADIAENHHVTVETVRTQMKAVLSKTGVHRQSDIAVKLAALPRFR